MVWQGCDLQTEHWNEVSFRVIRDGGCRAGGAGCPLPGPSQYGHVTATRAGNSKLLVRVVTVLEGHAWRVTGLP